MTRRVMIPLTTRGNYAKMRSTMAAIAARDDLELLPVVGGPLLDAGYGDHREMLAADGFGAVDELDYLDGPADLAGMTRAAGRCVLAMQEIIARRWPDWLMVVADRYEALAIAQAALCMNVRIAHLEGGEVSGSIDERIRHAITKLAHLHFPANREAAARLERMGEPGDAIVTVGTPSLDLIAGMELGDLAATAAFLATNATGRSVDLDKPFLVISFHPVVTEVDDAPAQFAMLADAVRRLGLPSVWVLPNRDAGAGAAAEPVDALLADSGAPAVQRIGSLPIEHYARLLANAACVVGNSSSGLRESAFLGAPTVNIGTRQQGRARGANVADVGHDLDRIVAAVEGQITHGRYPRDGLYGDGAAGPKIAAALAAHWPALDKTIVY
ncbi:MAG: UDP-N-acetylglucosamine 2-epimerase [Alphaproteobacteria bacterium]